MSRSAEVLARLPQKLLKNGLVRLSTSPHGSPTPAASERRGEDWDQALESGLLEGGVVELSIGGGVALGTSLALSVCRHAQEQALLREGHNVWCAFIDPRGSLYAPGVAAAGVDLSRLLVLHPDESSLSRVALRLVEARHFSVVVIDTLGVPGASLDTELVRWVQVVRRLERALHLSSSTVILLTDQYAKRPLPLPVTKRYELVRTSNHDLAVRVARDAKAQCGLASQFSVRKVLRRKERSLHIAGENRVVETGGNYA